MANDDDLSAGTWVTRTAEAVDVARVRACRLEVVSGPDAGTSVTVATSRVRIGRQAADLVLTDRKVSAIHAEIELDEQGYRLRDLGSANGTFVAGVRILEAYVTAGAQITVGDTVVRFVPEAGSVEVALFPEVGLAGLVGASTAMRRLFAQIDRAAATDATVLITGETGVGKERVAQGLHDLSARAEGPFVVLDCGAVPRQLFESQLFGHEAGAFTDARRASPGVFELADGGTLFLDEIGELPLELQTRLLRVVEMRSVRRLGGSETRELDVRVVAATNRNLAAEVNRGSFRTDLYHRLAVVELNVPPLRERPGDVELLVAHFVAELDPKGTHTLPDDFLPRARSHPWPGNVRQLRNAVERTITLGDWAPTSDVDTAPAAPLEVDIAVPFREAKQRLVDDFDRRYLTKLLDAHRGNVSAAARAAGLDRMSIYKAMQRLGLGDRTR